MDISNNTNIGLQDDINRSLEIRQTLADISRAKDNGPFVPHFAVESVSAFGVTDEGRTMHIQLQGRDGPGLVLDLATADCDAVLEGIVRARAAARAVGSGEIAKFVLTGWKTWELGNMADGTVVLFLDKGAVSQKAFPFQLGDALQVGKGFIAVARKGNDIKSRIVRT